jgi:hypothetical protein
MAYPRLTRQQACAALATPGIRLTPDRVQVAHRAGTRPEERCCGRTLAEDLRWTRAAIGRALARAS